METILLALLEKVLEGLLGDCFKQRTNPNDISDRIASNNPRFRFAFKARAKRAIIEKFGRPYWRAHRAEVLAMINQELDRQDAEDIITAYHEETSSLPE